MSFKSVIASIKPDIFPVLGFDINTKPFILFDGSGENSALNNIDLSDVVAFTDYAFSVLKDNNAIGSIGGYLEKRVIYKATPYFGDSDRDIHLGVDIFMEAGTVLFAPLNGKIHSFANNKGHGNYGGTIVLEHKINGFKFHTLYGHLSLTSLDGKIIGQKINKGDLLCFIGDYPENGNWPPHLHFQIIIDIEGEKGDYVGVCSEKDLAFYKENCPDPNLILQSNLLK